MVLENHFDRFIHVLSAALILMSEQSVGANPVMNVSRSGSTWRHIPSPGPKSSCGTAALVSGHIVRADWFPGGRREVPSAFISVFLVQSEYNRDRGVSSGGDNPAWRNPELPPHQFK